jgi:hypothetical protein
MIEVNTLEAPGFKGEFCQLTFQRLGFLLFPAFDCGQLAHFSKPKQGRLGKMNVHFDLTCLLKFPQFFKQINYILVTDFNEILYLPFVSKLFPEATIIATNLASQLGRISV